VCSRVYSWLMVYISYCKFVNTQYVYN